MTLRCKGSGISSKNVRAKGAPEVQAAALKTYGRMVHDCMGNIITLASLMAGKLLHAN